MQIYLKNIFDKETYMYSQQRAAILLDHDLESFSFPYKHIFKQVTLPGDFQNMLGVVKGDSVIIRPNMLSRTAACVIVGEGPEKDMGNDIVRISPFARKIIKSSVGQAVLVERIDVIPAEELKIEWFITNQIKKYLEAELKSKINSFLANNLFVELADLPLMVADRFTTTLSLPNHPEHTYKITYWIRKAKPGFPVFKLVPSTTLHIY